MTDAIPLQFQRLSNGEGLPLPVYQTAGAAGMDLAAAIDDAAVEILEPGERRLIPTGFAAAVPPGFEMQIRPRSGLALKHGVTVLNTPGTIDSDYRGEIQVMLVNLGREPFSIARGDRVAQAVIAPVIQASIVEVGDLDDTERGTGGFGSTGTT